MLSLKTKKYLGSAILGLLAFSSYGVANAATISWVDFSTWEAGQHDGGTGNPFSSSTGLVVDAEFVDSGGVIRPTYPKYLATTLDDAAWPFSNDLVPSVVTIGTIADGDFDTTLTMDFTNAGGLPVGGSLGIIDLELENSWVKLTGFQSDGMGGFTEVAVNWAVSHYQTAGVDVDPPNWDPMTNTASGNVNSFDPLINNFMFLISDIALDRLVLDIHSASEPNAQPQARSDGIAFAVSAETVPERTVPEPVSLLLIGSGLAGLAIRRRRTSAPRG